MPLKLSDSLHGTVGGVCAGHALALSVTDSSGHSCVVVLGAATMQPLWHRRWEPDAGPTPATTPTAAAGEVPAAAAGSSSGQVPPLSSALRPFRSHCV